MRFQKLILATAITFSLYGSALASETTIEDPYKDDEANSPWTQTMQEVTTLGGRVVRGDVTALSGKPYQGFDAYTPYSQDRTELVEGYGSTEVGAGCDGINLGGIVEGQLSQYSTMIESFIQEAPALAIMYLAYSQPTVKAVIDELNMVGQFGIDLSNMTCSGVRAMADKAAEEKVQATAEAQCTAEAGFKDPECMSDDGLLSNVSEIMKSTKAKVNDRAGTFLGKTSDATGGLIRFKGGVNKDAVTSGVDAEGNAIPGSTETLSRAESCSGIDTDGLRALLLGSSGMACDDIKKYAGLLPDYTIDDEGISGVVPRSLTVRKLAGDLVKQHEIWLEDLLNVSEEDYPSSEGFKAIFNRTNIAISKMQYRKLKLSIKENTPQGIGMLRNLAQLIALKDLNAIVGALEVAILVGIQNQPDDGLLPEFRSAQFLKGIDTLKSEVKSMNDEIAYDIKRSNLLGK